MPKLHAHGVELVVDLLDAADNLDNMPREDIHALLTVNKELRERLWQRIHSNAQPLKGIRITPGTEWLKPGLVGRVRHLKGEQLLRHATLRDIREVE